MSFKRPISPEWLTLMRSRLTDRLLITDGVSKNLHNVKTGRKRAAVLVPLCNRYGQSSLLFTLRTQSVGSHKGQVSFPGGHIEENESAVDAALREMHEELGIPSNKVTVLGEAQTVVAITGTLVTPIIGFIHDDLGDFDNGLIQPSRSEVERVFTRTIDHLLLPGIRSTEMLTRPVAPSGQPSHQQVEMPAFGPKGDPERIWGLTAMILDAVLHRLVLPTCIDNTVSVTH